MIGMTWLYQSDKQIIQSGEWLADKVIFVAENLLKQQHPHIHGLQNPLLQCTSTFEVMKGKQFIQILNREGNHWITISTVGCNPGTVNVYDSMNLPLSKELLSTVADLMHVSDDSIVVKYIKMQYQVGSSDCGLFAIASACAVCKGRNPGEMKFKQELMRHHLLMSLDNAVLTLFPYKPLRKHQPNIKEKRIPVYCVCRQPYNGEKMIECSICKKWFHCSCMHVSDMNISELVWVCKCCRHSNTNESI